MDASRVRRRALPNREPFCKGEGVSWEEDATWTERWALPAARTKPAASPPAAAPARPLARPFCSPLQHPPSPTPGTRAPACAPPPGTPSLRPGRASRAPSRVPLPPLSPLPIPPLPRRCSPSPGRFPGVGSSPGEWKIREAERVYRDAACALPAATPPAPDQRPPAAEAATKGPLQRAVPRCARRADTPEFAPLFSAGTGEGRGREGAAPRAPGASSPPGRWAQVRDAALEAWRAAALPLRRHWWRSRGMSTGRGAGPERAQSGCCSPAALGALTAAPRDGCGPPARPAPRPSRRAGWLRAAPEPQPPAGLSRGERDGRRGRRGAGGGWGRRGLGPGCDITADGRRPGGEVGAGQRSRDAPPPPLAQPQLTGQPRGPATIHLHLPACPARLALPSSEPFRVKPLNPYLPHPRCWQDKRVDEERQTRVGSSLGEGAWGCKGCGDTDSEV